MKIKLAVYNMEWMKDLFFKDGRPKTEGESDSDDRKDGLRSKQLANVVEAIDPDVLCIVEGPDTLKDGSKTASKQLEAWCTLHNLDTDYRGVHGFPSGGQQELCALFKKSKVQCKHAPVRAKAKKPFNAEFFVDTTDSLIKERYKHYRPPFEISVEQAGGGDELMRIIVAHTKSKGIFDSVDLARYEQLSERNRRKLYAECFSIRGRCDQWLEDNPDLKLAVVGDINDGFGLDYYEQRFSRSAVETLLGNVWAPERILRSVLPQPKLGKYGWTPSSSSFRDVITENRVNVLIDHILVSQSVDFDQALVWNPFLKDAPQAVKSLKPELRGASDHFPVSVEMTI